MPVVPDASLMVFNYLIEWDRFETKGRDQREQPFRCRFNQGEDRNTMASNVKQAVIELIESLPEDTSVADIMAELYFHRKVEEGIKQLDAGQGIDHETAMQRLRKWSS
jgi:hypothetical protein